ncbi:MAG: hypothetical protein ACYCZB_00995 [Acidiphilium sp.]
MAHLLTDPELITMIEADRRFGRLLRPLCHTLGIRLPPCLQRPKPTPKPAKSARKRRTAKPAPAFRLILDPVRPAQTATPPLFLHPHAPPKPA